jgi:hypothetical protein
MLDPFLDLDIRLYLLWFLLIADYFVTNFELYILLIDVFLQTMYIYSRVSCCEHMLELTCHLYAFSYRNTYKNYSKRYTANMQII